MHTFYTSNYKNNWQNLKIPPQLCSLYQLSSSNSKNHNYHPHFLHWVLSCSSHLHIIYKIAIFFFKSPHPLDFIFWCIRGRVTLKLGAYGLLVWMGVCLRELCWWVKCNYNHCQGIKCNILNFDPLSGFMKWYYYQCTFCYISLRIGHSWDYLPLGNG